MLGPKPDDTPVPYDAVMAEIQHYAALSREHSGNYAWWQAATAIVQMRQRAEKAEGQVRGLEQQIRGLERDVAIVLRRRGYIVQQPGEEG